MNLAEYSTRMAEQFLQTAVFVDDKIYEDNRETVKAVSSDNFRKTRGAARKSARKAVQVPLMPPKENDRGLRCQDIVESFAKKRIVCSLYQLGRKSGAGPQSNLYKLVASADILVVDWDIEGDKGKKASQLVVNLVKSSLENEPEQLRSIIVYTAEPNLKVSVADKLYEGLTDDLGGEFNIELKTEDKGLAFHTKNSRITILGKPITTGRSKEFSEHEVLEANLAPRAIAEFSKLADGLLQGAALQGMALIRRNTRKILTMFGKELDAAFLLHRALSLPQEDASDHLVPILVSEIESVLEDQIENIFTDHALLDSWCDTHAKFGDFANRKFSKTQERLEASKILVRAGPQLRAFAESKQVTLAGIPAKPEESSSKLLWNLKTGKQVEAMGSFILSDEEAKVRQAMLAALMSQRTFYSDKRILCLGTVLREGKDYYLCIQPACDCVRLKGWSAFPLLKLAVSDKGFDLVVIEDNQVVKLATNFKPNSISLFQFKAGPSSGVVEAKHDEGKFCFQGGSSIKGPKREFKFIAQLKIEQALRCVANISGQLGRVGLSESVWARVMRK